MTDQVIVTNTRTVTVTAPGPQGATGASGGGGGAVTSVDGLTGVVSLASSYQPLDSDLTAIAALTTTAYGRAFLALADAAAARTAVTLGNVDNTSDANKPISTAVAAVFGTNPQGQFADLATRWAAQRCETLDPAAGSMYTIPGCTAATVQNVRGIVIDTDYYLPLFCQSALTFDRVAVEVTTVSGSAGSVGRVGLYNATSAWQPTGTLIEDFGTFATDSLGVKTLTPATGSRTLPGGRYVLAHNCNGAAPQYRIVRTSPSSMLEAALGTSATVDSLRVTRTYAAFQSSGTVWTTATAGSAGFAQFVFLRCTAEAA